jgi:hypothetical protein
MEKRTYRQRHVIPGAGLTDAYAFGLDHYEDLLQQAEQYRLEQRALRHENVARNSKPQAYRSPIARLLTWAGIVRAKPLGIN